MSEIDIQTIKEPKYTKEEILKSNIFRNVDKDMLSVLLKEGSIYTIGECKGILKREAKRKVVI